MLIMGHDLLNIQSSRHNNLIGLCLGVFGGAALIVTTIFTSKGPAVFIPYTVLLVVTFTVLRAVNWSSFSKRFSTTLLAFMVSTISLYLFIGIFDAGTIVEITAWGHIWRLGFMALIGSLLSFIVSYLVNIGKRSVCSQ